MRRAPASPPAQYLVMSTSFVSGRRRGSAGRPRLRRSQEKRRGANRPAFPLWCVAQAFWIATPELVEILTPLVSRRNSDPTIRVITATPMGYQRPA